MYPLGGSDLLLPVVAFSEDESGAFPFEDDADDDTCRCC